MLSHFLRKRRSARRPGCCAGGSSATGSAGPVHRLEECIRAHRHGSGTLCRTGAAHPVWTDVRDAGHPDHCGEFAAGQRARETRAWRPSGSTGEEAAAGRQSQHWAPSRSRVLVRENEAGRIQIRYRDHDLLFREVPWASTARSEGRGAAPSPAPPSPRPKSCIPMADHPWRRNRYQHMKTPAFSSAW